MIHVWYCKRINYQFFRKVISSFTCIHRDKKSKLRPVLYFEGATPDGISVDPVSRLIFYTDTGYNVISLITIDGAYSKTIINQNLDEPRAIVTNPQTG